MITGTPTEVFFYRQRATHSPMNTFINYIKDTRAELAHVSWPTRRQAAAFTAVVVVVSILTAVFLGFFDYLFSLILQKFII